MFAKRILGFQSCYSRHRIYALFGELVLYQVLSKQKKFFKIFGNPTRLKIISLLAVDDLCVCDICEALDLNQTTVSNQLRILRANNIVKYQKEGKMARYSLTDLHIEMIYKVGLEHILE